MRSGTKQQPQVLSVSTNSCGTSDLTPTSDPFDLGPQIFYLRNSFDRERMTLAWEVGYRNGCDHSVAPALNILIILQRLSHLSALAMKLNPLKTSFSK
jgi:hypothetical protein